MASSSSSPRNWLYDVFPSFSGEDVRLNFLSHFLKELERKLIIAFRDNKIERGRSLDPELKQAIKDSRIAVVVFSKNYASSSWCLNELLEIVNCKKEYGQTVIPVFYGLDPSHVRKQTGDFGEIFEETCRHNKTEEVKIHWREALTSVANTLGYHSVTCGNEAKMIEEIVDDILVKLLLTTSKDFEEFVGMEDHIANINVLLQLESEDVRMVGIWGSSGIGKTTIARVLFNQISRHFQGSVFIDKHLISKSMEISTKGNPDDYNMKLHLQEKFLSKILDKEGIKVDHLGAVREKLKQRKVLIIIDDLDDQVVLDALAGQIHWFGCGSRIIVVTKDKQFFRANRIDHIYEVYLPCDCLALEMLCRSAFRQNSPPDSLKELASEVALRAGNLPLGLNVLGSLLRGRDVEDWMDMMPRLRNGLDGKIERTLRVSYDGLNNQKDKAIFRHIACLFNGKKVDDIKLLLAKSDLDVNIGLKNLVDKSLLHVRYNTVEMHCLLREMGKEIVRTQSNEPGEREFIVDLKDVCDVLENNTGTKKVLGIALDVDEIDELHIHENAFKEMHNLLFLEIFSKECDKKEEAICHLPKGFYYFPNKLRLLRFDGYPLRCLPSNFRPENLVKLQMTGSKLERLWEGVHSLRGLKDIDLRKSRCLQEIPNLSMATNLETLNLCDCSSLVELPSFIQHLNKLEFLDMSGCINLETLPTGINLQSLDRLDLSGCSRLKNFHNISTNISILSLSQTGVGQFPNLSIATNLKTLDLCHCLNLVELPFSIQYLNKLEFLVMKGCINLETLPTGINLQTLSGLDLRGCSRLKSFPDISTNIRTLSLCESGIEEFPSNLLLKKLIFLSMNKMKSEKLWEREQPLTSLMTMLAPSLKKLFLSDIPTLVELPSSIQKFSKLEYLGIIRCTNLETLPNDINLQYLYDLDLRGCSRLRTFPDISTNISMLYLTGTGIEEVPWWIQNFSNLTDLAMNNCNSLIRVSLNIYKLKHLTADFTDCAALTKASWNDSASEVAMETDNIHSKLPLPHEASFPLPDDYRNVGFTFKFFDLDQEALLQQQSVFFESMILSGEEVPSYFTHRTTGTSSLINIPLLHTNFSQQFFKFRVCAVVIFDSIPINCYSGVYIHVNCRFKGRFGNSFDFLGRPHDFWADKKDGHLFILECRIPLNKDNYTPLAQLRYDHVDMQIHISNIHDQEEDMDPSTSKLKGWGIRLLEDCSTAENRLGSPNTLPHVCEVNDDNMGYTPFQGLVNETEHSEKSGDSNVDTERSRKRMRLYNFI